VAQRYLAKPLLINGLKFDLRVYALVISCDPLRVFVYREGLARFCTVPYARPTAANLGTACMHLTNYAVNKHSSSLCKSGASDGRRVDGTSDASECSVFAYERKKGGGAGQQSCLAPDVSNRSGEYCCGGSDKNDCAGIMEAPECGPCPPLSGDACNSGHPEGWRGSAATSAGACHDDHSIASVASICRRGDTDTNAHSASADACTTEGTEGCCDGGGGDGRRNHCVAANACRSCDTGGVQISGAGDGRCDSITAGVERRSEDGDGMRDHVGQRSDHRVWGSDNVDRRTENNVAADSCCDDTTDEAHDGTKAVGSGDEFPSSGTPCGWLPQGCKWQMSTLLTYLNSMGTSLTVFLHLILLASAAHGFILLTTIKL
jgi:hypothetical protein